jgi:hypothetical protein
MERLDDGRDVIGQIDREVPLAVRKFYMHCATVVEKVSGGKAGVLYQMTNGKGTNDKGIPAPRAGIECAVRLYRGVGFRSLWEGSGVPKVVLFKPKHEQATAPGD